jgi:protein-S-isoprenylcysteine O-methyltransferase Ste14
MSLPRSAAPAFARHETGDSVGVSRVPEARCPSPGPELGSPSRYDAPAMAEGEQRAGPGANDGIGLFGAAYAGLAGFFAIEWAVRQPGSASSLVSTDDDQRTTQKIVIAYTAAAILAPIVRRSHLGRLPPATAPVGLALELCGLGIRAWSMRTLGSSYGRTLRTGQSQGLTEDGPYRFVRHPGYAGSLLTWTGFAVASRSSPAVGVVGGLLAWAYRDRIRAEEVLLERNLPGYKSYMRRTWRLAPYVW